MGVGVQSYAPYRTALLSWDDVRQLQQLRPSRVVRDTFFGWLGILCGFGLVWAIPEWYTVAIAIPLIGTRYYSLLIVAHDGLHRRLFNSPKTSNLWNDVFIIGAVGAITRLNRRNHMTHHGLLATPLDPDRYKYVGGNKTSRMRFLLVLTGLPYVLRAVGNVFLGSKTPNAKRKANDTRESGKPMGYTTRDIAILVGWQVALVGGLTWSIGWWAYPTLWLVPVYCFGYVADIVRVFCEHSVMGNDDDADRTIRLISFVSNPVERQFFAPHNMNCHIAHHLWPSIPYYNLPETERRLRQALHGDATSLVWRESYVKYLFGYWRWLGQLPPPVECANAR